MLIRPRCVLQMLGRLGGVCPSVLAALGHFCEWRGSVCAYDGCDGEWLLCRCEPQGSGETPLYTAASRRQAEVVRLLIEAKADVNQATVCTSDAGVARGSVSILVSSAGVFL